MRPNLFIVGAAKAGTTFLHGALSLHHEIAMSRPKEPGYFSDPEFPERVARTLGDYRQLFPGSSQTRFMGEASVNYLFSQGAATRICDFSPDARIVISVRSPAEVIISLHRTLVFHGHQSERDLSRALAAATRPNGSAYPWLRYYDAVLFSEQIARYLDVFPREAIRIVNFDDLVQQPEAVVTDLLAWLGLSGVPDLDCVSRNERTEPRSWLLSRWLRRPPKLVRVLGGALPESSMRTLASWVKRRNAARGEVSAADEQLRQRLLRELEPEIRRLEDVLKWDLKAWLPQP